MKTKNKKPLEGFTKKKSLNKYSKQDLFVEKLEMANKILKNAGLPKDISTH